MHSQEYKPRKMMSAPEAASYCGSSASTFAKLRLYGGGPVFLKLGRRVVYNPVDLDAWLASRRRTSTSDGALVPANGEHKVVVSESEGTRQP